MNCTMPIRSAIVAALLLALSSAPVSAARFSYHGDLMDGDAPAQGHYDVRLRAFAAPNTKAALGEATELPNVKVIDGRLAVEMDLPQSPVADTYIEVAIRKAGTGGDYEVLGTPQAVNKVNTGCWALDGNMPVAAGSFLGNADPASLVPLELRANRGVGINAVPPDANVELTVTTNSNGGDFSNLWLKQRAASNAGVLISVGNASAANNSGFYLDQYNGSAQTRRLELNPNGSVIWTDPQVGALATTASNQFLVRAGGGVGINLAPTPSFFTPELTIGPTAALDAETTLALAHGAREGMLTLTDDGDLSLEALGGHLSLETGALNKFIRTNNYLGVVRTPTANALEVQGDASKIVAGAWLANSDRRIKAEIQPIPNALDTVLKLRPVTFRYADRYRKSNSGIEDRRYYNVIAQEFAEVFPDAVKGSGEYLPGKPKSRENEILQVDTYPAQITALAAIQELAVEDDALREELTAMRRDSAALREDNRAIKRQLERVLERLAQLEAQR